MSFMWLVYLFSTLSNLGQYLAVITALTACAIVIFIIANLIRWGDTANLIRWGDTWPGERGGDATIAAAKGNVVKGVKYLIVAALFGLIPTLLPSEKTMYMMVAAGAAQTVVDNTQVNDVAKEGMDVVKQFLVREKERLLNEGKK